MTDAIGVLIAAVLPWVAGIAWLVARGGRSILLPRDERIWTMADVWARGRGSGAA